MSPGARPRASVRVPHRGGRCIGWGHGLPLPGELRGPGGPCGARRPRLGLWEETLHPRGESLTHSPEIADLLSGLASARADEPGLLRCASQQGRGEDGPRAGETALSGEPGPGRAPSAHGGVPCSGELCPGPAVWCRVSGRDPGRSCNPLIIEPPPWAQMP